MRNIGLDIGFGAAPWPCGAGSCAIRSHDVIVPVPEEPTGYSSESNGSLVGGLNFPNLIDNLPTLPNMPNGANVSLRAADFLDAADKHVPTLSLNARRKFFHALAVAMFLPGVACDVG